MKNLTKEQLIKKLTEERDLAVKQLNSIGVGLGDNMDHVKVALEKQIPRTPNLWGDGYSDSELVYDNWDCPNCGYTFEVEYEKHRHCPECGQRIEW